MVNDRLHNVESMLNRVSITKLQKRMRTQFIGKTMFFSRKVSSTNDRAKQLAVQGVPAGTVVIAATQTHGRGRLDRKWISPVGGLWFSVILKPEVSVSKISHLTFVTSLAVAECLKDLYGLKVETKWPNDVLVKGRKICGILGETSSTEEKATFVILGVGVNVNFDTEKTFPEPIRLTTTSVEKELGHKVKLETLLKALLEKFERTLGLCLNQGFKSVLSEWKKYAFFLGNEVEVVDRISTISGTACDIAEDGALVLRSKDGSLRHIFAGDLFLRISENPR